MNLRALRTLVTIAETGSFRAAARRLHMTESAVSLQMKGLEDALGAVVFDRSRRPPVLAQGQGDIVEQARDILLRLDRLRARAGGDDEPRGRLRLGAIPSVTGTLMPPTLSRLRVRYPELQIGLRSGLSEALIRRVTAGELDAALITAPPEQTPGLRASRLYDERLVVIAPRRVSAHEPWAILSSAPFIRFDPNSGVGALIDAYIRAAGVPVSEAMVLDSLQAIRAMVEQGLGVAILPERSLRAEGEPALSVLSLPPPEPRRRIDVVYPEHAADNRALAALIEALRATALPPA